MSEPILTSPQVNSSLTPYTGEWGDVQIRHLLSRTLFGIRKADIESLRTMTVEEAVDRILTPAPRPPLPVNDYNRDDLVDPYVEWGDTWVWEPQPEEGELINARIVSLKTWWIEQMLNQDLSITEKLILFWHNHLCTLTWEVYYPKLSFAHFNLLRNHAFGNFKQMMRAVTIDAQMLLFLNGAFNNKEAPDENFARELQELFCIGKGPDAGYTEDDVKAAARVLTGWSFDWEHGVGTWFDWAHDEGDKQFSAFYGNKLIQGGSGTAGRHELDQLMDMIFDNQETARFICRKLYRFFVYSEIDEQVELNVIRPLANIFRDSGYEITPTLRALFTSDHFYDLSNHGAMIKSPVDFLVGYWRSMNLLYPQGATTSNKREIRQSMLWNMSGQGQQLMDPPNVAGWPAYHQTPIFDKSWISTDSVPNRAITTDSFVYWGFWSRNLLTNVDLFAFIRSLNDPADLNSMMEETLFLILPVEATTVDKARLRSILLTGQNNDSYWTDAWLEYEADPNNAMKKNVVETRIKPFFQYIFQLSEFHLH